MPEPDRPTVHAHKRQFAWQILLPVVGTAVLVIAGATLAVVSPEPGTRTLADVSLVWLIFPLLIAALAFLVVLCFLIYLMAQLTKVVPPAAAKAQYYSAAAAAGTRKLADAAAQPVVWLRQLTAAIQRIFRL